MVSAAPAPYNMQPPQTAYSQTQPFNDTMGGQVEGLQGLNTGGYPGSDLMGQVGGTSQNFQTVAPGLDYSQLTNGQDSSAYQLATNPYADPSASSDPMSYLSPDEQQLLFSQGSQQGLSNATYGADSMGGGTAPDYSRALSQGNWTYPSAATGQFTQGQSFDQSGQTAMNGGGQQYMYGGQTQDPNAMYSTGGYGMDPSSYMASYGAGQGGQQAGSGMSFTG